MGDFISVFMTWLMIVKANSDDVNGDDDDDDNDDVDGVDGDGDDNDDDK